MKRVTVAVVAALVLSVPAAAQTLKVILLGTGTPIPRVERAGPATLVEAGSEKLLFDCGRNAIVRLTQAHLPSRDVTAVFFTHLHSDHVVGFPDFLLTGWLPGPAHGRRIRPVVVFGPAGTKDMMANLGKAYAADIRIRMDDEKLPREGSEVDATDIALGFTYEKNGAKVTAFDVDHGPLIKPSLGYRVDYGGHSVVISGDTRVSDNLVRHAAGTDVLIHEVMAADPEILRTSPAAQRIAAHHTSPADAGRVFSRVKPKLAVFSHIGLMGDAKEEDIARQARTTYSGPFVLGQDLMTIDIGDQVVVEKP